MIDQKGAPLLSVIVPFYNVEAFFAECLESLQAQTLTDLEVIMVDDGSPDGCAAIAAEFAARDPRFRLVQQENQGLGPARNTGVRHARGRYLTFVDSDDVVAPRAYSRMVGSLEESGSAFCAGNAYRFSQARGVYQSWTHRNAFRTDRIATSLAEFPTLVEDRMVWNKVYRHDFWTGRRLSFPGMRYEDYPVVLRAYLEAPHVDVVSDHIYFWRDRESIDSITQRALELDNVRDRFISASMTMDEIDLHYPPVPEVRDRVHAYFAHVDLVTIAEALAAAPAQERTRFAEIATTFARRLNPDANEGVSRLAILIREALAHGHEDLAIDLAAWRGNGDVKALVRKLAKGKYRSQLPAVMEAVVRRKKVSAPWRPRRLRSVVTAARWNESGMLELEVSTTLRRQFAQRARVTADLEVHGGHIRVQTTATVTGQGFDLRLVLDPADVAGSDADWTIGKFRISITVGPLRWRGPVRFQPEALPGIRQAPGRWWIQPRGVGWDYGIERLENPLVIETATVSGESIVLEPGAGTAGSLVIRRPDPTVDLRAEVADGPLSFSLADLVGDDLPDNPVTGVAERSIVRPELAWQEEAVESGETQSPQRVRRTFWRRPKVVKPPPVMVEVEVDRRWYLAGEDAHAVLDQRKVTVGRGWYGHLVVRQEPLAPDHLVEVPDDDADSGDGDAGPDR